MSGAALASVVVVYGGQIWRQARRAPEPAIAAPARSAAAVVIAAAGRVELAGDRRTVTRLAGDAPRWTAPQPAALDAIELTGPLVLGHTPEAIAAIDLESGRTRFTWALPTDERWGAQRPVALGGCLIAITSRGGKLVARCLDLATGAVRWTAAPAGAHDCTQPVDAVPGAYLLPCPGWTAVLDDRTGAVSVEPGGIGLVQDDPALLLRARTRLALSPWSAAKRRFTQTGELGYGGAAAATSSAVLHKDRLVLRAVESSDELAVIVPRTGNPIPVAAPVYRLADATPLVRSCGGASSPRYQLLELAPRIGASFDPATAGDRALALLDVETGALAWTSRKLAGLHAGTPGGGPPICRAGHYAIPLELPGRGAAPASVLWVVDAETGRTTAAVALDPALDASFARLTADQIDGDRLVGLGRTGPFELRWQPPGPGLRDARRELEAALGPLP
ncbi:MAG TPA: hypothetical protein VK601_28780 [Kofleriaceae bacterium]|nr:hypothetical protein [Kofleriaceae bacterium]